MIFCGQCGYQLAPGDKTCPRCGAITNVDDDYAPEAYERTEFSQAVIEHQPTQTVRPPDANQANRSQVSSQANQSGQPGPLILGPVAPNHQFANEPTTMMSAQNYGVQPGYPYNGYQQQQANMTGFGGYGQDNYQSYQAGQAAAVAQIYAASQRGKTTSLVLILLGILLLLGAVVIFFLNQQGIIF